MYKTKLEIEELESGDYHTLVKGSVAGQKVRIVLDTGASHSCVDANYASMALPDLQCSAHEGVTAGIGGDDFQVRVANLPDFKVGRFHLSEYENVALIDFSYINMAYQKLGKKPIQMILGNDFFVQHKACINYLCNELIFIK